MARIREMRPIQKDRNSVHAPVECSYSIFRSGGQTYLQLDTYGSADRLLHGKVSQSIPFDEASARQLKQLIEEAFPALR